MTLRCHKAHRLVILQMDTQLPLVQRVWLRIHLAACDACTNFKQELALLRRAVQGLDRY
jgi:hypothetical protein